MKQKTIKELAKEICERSVCHHKCQDTKDCIVEEEAELLINQTKSNNFEVKSNNELFKQALVEGVNRHFDRDLQIAEMTETINELYGADAMYYGVDSYGIAAALYNAGYRKHTDRFLVKENGEFIPLLPKQSEGEWLYHECVCSGDGLESGYSCSCCGAFIYDEVFEDTSFPNNFCPNCGSKMKGGAE